MKFSMEILPESSPANPTPSLSQVRVGAGLLPSTLQLTLILSPGEADSGAAAERRIAGPRGIAATWPLSSVICDGVMPPTYN